MRQFREISTTRICDDISALQAGFQIGNSVGYWFQITRDREVYLEAASLSVAEPQGDGLPTPKYPICWG